MKALLKENGPLGDPHAANLKEIMGVMERFESGIPQRKFADVAKRLKSKL
jgi:hypothetical protein